MNSRKPSTKRNGKDFSEKEEQLIWEKARIIDENTKDEERLDICGALIKRHEYGKKRQCPHEWEIDHIKPVNKGGGDELDNLQPLHWRNNLSKDDDFPATPDKYCKITNFTVT